MHRSCMCLLVFACAAVVVAVCGCERETPPPPLLPPPLDQTVKVPPPPPPFKAQGQAIPPMTSSGGAKLVFSGVKPMLTAPAGTAKDSRGDFTAVYAKLQLKVLWVWIEFSGPVDKTLNYRLWISNDKGDPPTLVLVDKGALGLQMHDKGKIYSNIKLPTDSSDGLLLRIPQKDMPPHLQDAKRLWVGNFGSIDIKDPVDGKATIVTYKSADQTIEAMPIPDR